MKTLLSGMHDHADGAKYSQLLRNLTLRANHITDRRALIRAFPTLSHNYSGFYVGNTIFEPMTEQRTDLRVFTVAVLCCLYLGSMNSFFLNFFLIGKSYIPAAHERYIFKEAINAIICDKVDSLRAICSKYDQK